MLVRVDVCIVTIPEGPLDIKNVVVPVVVSVVGMGKTAAEVVSTVGANVLIATVPVTVRSPLLVPNGAVVLGRGNGTGDSVTLCGGAVFPAPVLEKPVASTESEPGMKGSVELRSGKGLDKVGTKVLGPVTEIVVSILGSGSTVELRMPVPVPGKGPREIVALTTTDPDT